MSENNFEYDFRYMKLRPVQILFSTLKTELRTIMPFDFHDTLLIFFSFLFAFYLLLNKTFTSLYLIR